MKPNTDKNHEFILKYLTDYPRAMPQKINLFSSQIARKRRQLQNIDPVDRCQWAELMSARCQSMFMKNIDPVVISSNGKSTIINTQYKDMLKNTVILVLLSKQFECRYNNKAAQTILKSVYIEQTSSVRKNTNINEIVKVFKQYNFDTSQLEVLEYEDPWYTRMARWFNQ